MIISSVRHEVQTIPKSTFQTLMVLTIRHLQADDFGYYTCAAKNSLGEVDFSIRLYGKSILLNSITLLKIELAGERR